MADTQLLSGRYDIGTLIGTGGMAEVRHARDTRLGRDVAIKFLRADLARDPSFHARFEREAQAAASLNHPAIVAVYDTGEQGGRPYIVMEYVRGETLRELLDREGRLAPQQALQIVSDVLRALDYSHRHGIVHRDIKPANVMVTRSGDVKVMDFGIARALTASSATMTQTAAVIGTAHYLSPEQARGDHVDARSDIYSTGCLLYELLTGAPPFTGESAVAVAYQHVREEPLPPSALEPDVSPALDAVVLMAMAKNPANRYQSAADMRADVDRALAGVPVLARPVLAEAPTVAVPPPATTVLLQRPVAPQSRHRVAYLLLALSTVVVFVAAALIARALVPGPSAADINTPNVTGVTLAQAESNLHLHGLLWSVKRAYSPKPADTVIVQSPLPGILLAPGQSVSLTVSEGLQMVSVPQLVGLSLADARTALSSAHLQAGAVQYQDSTAPANHVLASSPAPGQSVPAGTKITLTVSKGDVQVVNVQGVDLATARAELTTQGLKVTVVTTYNANQPFDVVVSQNPAGGALVPPGTLVTVTVNRAPSESPTPTPSANASASPSASASPPASPTASPNPTPSGTPNPSPGG